MMKKLFLSPLLLVLSVLLGCDDGNVSFSGRVTFSDDGSPLTTGTVCFLSEGSLARGRLKPDGTYSLGTAKVDVGLPPGTYQVYVSGSYEPLPDPPPLNVTHGTPLIDQKFMEPATSGLSVKVTKDIRKFDFQIDRYKPKR